MLQKYCRDVTGFCQELFTKSTAPVDEFAQKFHLQEYSILTGTLRVLCLVGALAPTLLVLSIPCRADTVGSDQTLGNGILSIRSWINDVTEIAAFIGICVGAIMKICGGRPAPIFIGSGLALAVDAIFYLGQAWGHGKPTSVPSNGLGH